MMTLLTSDRHKNLKMRSFEPQTTFNKKKHTEEQELSLTDPPALLCHPATEWHIEQEEVKRKE